jgi:hypothetical protein
VRDFVVNQQFRKDYWVKGARTLTLLEQAEQLRAQKVMLTCNRFDVSLKIKGALGDADLSVDIYNPILDLMADYKSRTIAQIEHSLKEKGVNFAQLLQAVLLLCGNGTLSLVQDEAIIAKAKKHTDKLNSHLLHKARSSHDISYLSSPVTGGGVFVGRFQQLFVLAIQQGKKKPEEWAAFVSQLLIAQGQKIVKEGVALQTPEEHMKELTAQAQEFAAKLLPLLKALHIA